MANSKISNLDVIASLSDDDLLVVVNDPAGTPTTNKITVANALGGKADLSGAAFTGAVQGNTFTTTNVSGSIVYDFATNQNFVLTLSGNLTLANPTTEAVGQSGFFVFIQPSTGGPYTVSLGTEFQTVGGAGLTLSTAANAVDVVPYIVQASGKILLGTPQLAFA
jgi:hypothetical protein